MIGLYILNYLYGGFLIDVNYNFEIYGNYINDNILIDLVKINDIKVVLICTNCFLEFDLDVIERRYLESDNSLNILLIDIDPNYEGFSDFKLYHVSIEKYVPAFQISGFIYNDFLLFTSTAIPDEENFNFEDEINYLSIFTSKNSIYSLF